MTPCAHSHSTSGGVLWPVRLSHTSNSRSGGRFCGKLKGSLRPACHTAQAACVAVGSCEAVGTGSAARIALSCSRSHGCRTALVPRAARGGRTPPGGGGKRGGGCAPCGPAGRRVQPPPAGGGMKQGQDLGCAAPDVFVRQEGRSLSWLPRHPGMRHGLKGAGLVLAPDRQPKLCAERVGLLDQLFLARASGSRTRTTPCLRLRITTPVSHQVRLFCQLRPPACRARQIV